ncbi:hypothetical protein CBR_g52001 [Chara braunii]|uniref:glutathione transferase n=1 Tax=Chara braunii TaxID=69332 RepID=A0A388K6N9_CHABU|nr:hypothetical protein CBR_g52001 [Chara braunii]|eukprot:GBG65701.1 hypothetical protein CBR_g52001 [Chara braunii]
MTSGESTVEREGGEGEGEVVLYSSWYCPYAQRARISLEEKRIAYRQVEVDLSNKPPELLAANPRGLVPAIIHNGKSLFESMVVAEYLDEAFPRGSIGVDGLPRGGLMPVQPYDRAIARIWIDFVGKKITATFLKVLQTQDPEGQEKAKSEYLGHIKELSSAMEGISPDGPFFMGEEFGIVDIALVPFAMRHGVLKHFRELSVPDSPEFSRFRVWFAAAVNWPSVKATSFDEKDILPILSKYANNTATSQAAIAIRNNAPLP